MLEQQKLIHELRILAKNHGPYRTVFAYFAERERSSRSSDTYSIEQFAKANDHWDINRKVLKSFFKDLERIGIGRCVSFRRFDWQQFNPISVGKVALGRADALEIRPQSRNQNEVSSLSSRPLESISDSELADELEKRGWEVTLKRRAAKDRATS
jgi:hypothetical protein